jgi:glycosyltransferase involved in cell wall biosynthesis
MDDVRTSDLRVMRVIARMNIGGPARQALLLDRGLRSRGWKTLLVYGSTGPGEGSLEDLVTEDRLDFERIPELGRRIRLLGDLIALRHIAGALVRHQPDVLHTHTAKAGALGRLCGIAVNAVRGRRRRILLVHTFHGHVLSGYFGRLGSAVVRWLERILGLGTHCIIAISQRQRHDLVNRFGIAAPEKVSVVPLGLDLASLLQSTPEVELRESLRLGATDFVVGYVGRFVPIKDLPTLLRAFRMVQQSVPGARLVMAGDGELRAVLVELASELGLSEHVRFLGWVRDLAALYASFDVVALSSRNEGTPVMLIEAMAAGLPVVATDVGGVGDIVESGVNGLLVQAGNPDALARALIEMAGDPERRRQMGRAGRQSVASRLDIRRLVEDIDRLYRDGLCTLRGAAPAAS